MNEQVLVIDDEQDSVDSICDHLNLEKITCRGETDPKKAIEGFQANPTDIVIVDYLLSDPSSTTGLDVISTLKDIKPFTRFILISGYMPVDNDDTDISEILKNRMKVDRFIPKPYDILKLTALVRELLEGQESTSGDWAAMAEEYVAKRTVTAEQVRSLNEEFKQKIVEAFEKDDEN
jgi:DNA-binding NtrC family response regulator